MVPMDKTQGSGIPDLEVVTKQDLLDTLKFMSHLLRCLTVAISNMEQDNISLKEIILPGPCPKFTLKCLIPHLFGGEWKKFIEENEAE